VSERVHRYRHLHRIALVSVLATAGCRDAKSDREMPPSPTDVPEGMVYIPGGVTRIGDERVAEERPVFEAQVRPFFLDRHPVTVAQFRRFVQTARYVTDAERVGDAAVYDPETDQWRLVQGATWEWPLGATAPAAPDDHPVTQVSWNDAMAYAMWAGKRLPTEVEWEHAARGARNLSQPYAWGDSLIVHGRHRANTWQHPSAGTEPDDGHRFTAPVGYFGTTSLGLMDMGGNVWQWTADWYRPYEDREASFAPTSTSERVQRGGSFLCHRDICHGYRVSARSHSTPETALFNVGFRLAKDLVGR
jgi:formylglycine-generating enzyme